MNESNGNPYDVVYFGKRMDDKRENLRRGRRHIRTQMGLPILVIYKYTDASHRKKDKHRRVNGGALNKS